MSACKYPGCGLDVGARPYARSGIPSVTTVIGLLNLDERARKFAWNAAEAAAVTGVHRTKDWWELPQTVRNQPCSQDHHVEPGLCKACKFLRSEFDRRWREKAAIGEHIHHLAVSWAKGEDVESDATVDPYLDGLEAWYAEVTPQWTELERTIYYQSATREYVGTFDAICELPCDCNIASAWGRCSWLVDLKTGSGQWDLEWSLQLSAYRYAKSRTDWAGGKQKVVGKMPLVAHTGVLWLHDDGRAELVPVQTDAEAFARFLGLVDVFNWHKRLTAELARKEKEEAERQAAATLEAQVEATYEERYGLAQEEEENATVGIDS
jgi:hypothetical protein